MSKYRRYKCDTCLKEIDVVNDLTHAFIDRCNLTSGCNGTLRFVVGKNTKDSILNFDKIIQTDEIGNVAVDTSIGVYVDAASSPKNNLVLAVKGTAVDSSVVALTLNEVFNKERTFKEFVFNLNVPVSAVSGRDNSVDQKVLTFDSADVISIFVNGQEIDESRFTAENNIIRFNEVLTYNSFSSSSLFVKILVYSAEQSVHKSLSFRKNVQGLTECAWSNVDQATIGLQSYELFTCTEVLGIGLNTRLTVVSATLDSVAVNLSDIFLLLAEHPFGPLDRIVTKVICLADLNSTTDHLKFEVTQTGGSKFIVTSNSLKDVFPQVRPSVIFSAKDELDSSGNVGDDTSINQNINKNNKFILGPV